MLMKGFKEPFLRIRRKRRKSKKRKRKKVMALLKYYTFKVYKAIIIRDKYKNLLH